MKDRVVRIFPALLDQTLFGSPTVFYESVSILISVNVDPRKRQFNVWPERVYEVKVTGAPIKRSRQHHKQWGRINTAVVASERDFSQRRHFAVAGFMHDFAGLCFGLGIHVLRQGGRKVLQDSAC